MRYLTAALAAVALTIGSAGIALADSNSNSTSDSPNESRTSNCQADHALNLATCGIHLIELGNIF